MPMRPFRPQAAAFTIAVTLATAWGCGEGAPSVSTDTTEATVRGTVRIKGKPANGGEVFFDASNYRRKVNALRTAPIGKDGTYSIRTYVCENSVRVRSSAPGSGRGDESVKYDVKAGENVFDIDWPPAY